jgi:hypothetical protein
VTDVDHDAGREAAHVPTDKIDFAHTCHGLERISNATYVLKPTHRKLAPAPPVDWLHHAPNFAAVLRRLLASISRKLAPVTCRPLASA